jgi:hypothetical protein
VEVVDVAEGRVWDEGFLWSLCILYLDDCKEFSNFLLLLHPLEQVLGING